MCWVIISERALGRGERKQWNTAAYATTASRLVAREIRWEQSGEKSAAEEILGVTMRSKPSTGQKKPQRDVGISRRFRKRRKRRLGGHRQNDVDQTGPNSYPEREHQWNR